MPLSAAGAEACLASSRSITCTSCPAMPNQRRTPSTRAPHGRRGGIHAGGGARRVQVPRPVYQRSMRWPWPWGSLDHANQTLSYSYGLLMDGCHTSCCPLHFPLVAARSILFLSLKKTLPLPVICSLRSFTPACVADVLEARCIETRNWQREAISGEEITHAPDP